MNDVCNPRSVIRRARSFPTSISVRPANCVVSTNSCQAASVASEACRSSAISWSSLTIRSSRRMPGRRLPCLGVDFILKTEQKSGPGLVIDRDLRALATFYYPADELDRRFGLCPDMDIEQIATLVQAHRFQMRGDDERLAIPGYAKQGKSLGGMCRIAEQIDEVGGWRDEEIVDVPNVHLVLHALYA